MDIRRQMEPKIKELAQKFPAIALLGPRQSGKTTLARQTFPAYTYVSLEDRDRRTFALEDPRGFLATYGTGVGLILDEVHHAPELLSYLQTVIDAAHRPGFFILTGSHNLLLNEAISQTLAGRIALFTLLPLSVAELQGAHLLPNGMLRAVWSGFYPRIYAHDLNPRDWYPGYLQTYVERDVRDLKQIVDLMAFQKFLRLCAGRVGNLLNITSLANDAGISVPTVKEWLSVLAATYVIHLLQPYHENYSKRLIKAPKLYFYDTGLLCNLLNIETPEQLATHYLLGGIFESFVVSELYKQSYNRGLVPQYSFWRDKMGHEVDCILERSGQAIPIEIKAGSTISSDFFKGLLYWNELSQTPPAQNVLIYGGDEDQSRAQGRVFGWKNFWQL